MSGATLADEASENRGVALLPSRALTRRRGLAVLAALALPAPRAAWAEPRPQRRDWPRGRPTPPLELPALDGPAWRLEAQRGRVVALNFWASWCPPCRDEMPSLELMAQRHEADGMLVVAINFREGGGAIRRFVEQMALGLPVLRDAEGDAARAFGVRVFPSTVLIGRDGRVAFTVVGEADWGNAPARAWVAAML